MNFDNLQLLNYIPIVVILIVAIVVVPLLFRLMRNSAQNRALLATGLETDATILAVRETGVRINEQPQVNVTLQVNPPNGLAFQSQATTVISYFQAAQFQPGMTVRVRYDPDNTAKVAIAGVSPGGMSGFSVAGGVAGFNSGNVMSPQNAQMQNVQMQQLLQINAMNDALRKTGESAEARITNATNLGITVNGNNPVFRLQLEVHPDGRPMFAAQTTQFISEQSVAKYQTGATVWVKFDPNDISRVTIDHA